MYKMTRAVFFDKDGTLIKNVPYNVDPAKICLEPFASEALKLLQNNAYDLYVVSNQSGIALGYFNEADLLPVNYTIEKLLNNNGVHLNAFYYCTHLKNGTVAGYAKDCDCRKPKPGLLLQAAHDHNIDLLRSWMIGDILDDVEAGKSAGCKTILLNNGNETEWVLYEKRKPDFIVNNLKEAAELILLTDKVI
jgi:D-glycero-D-manno-heptose 1,7-bisphosphate phosphatase